MRVLHIFDHSAPLQSGYVTRSLGIMRAQRKNGVDPFGLTTPRHGAAAGTASALIEKVEGETFYRTPAAPHWSAPGPLGEMRATARRITEAVADLSPDVIHAHSPSLNAFPAIHAARAARLPLVYEIRAFWEDAAVDAGTSRPNSPRYRLTRALETRAARRVDHVFTICEGLRADLIARGLRQDRLSVAPNAIEPDRLMPIRARDHELAARFGLGPGPVLGFIGSFYPYEGLGLLLDAFPDIRAHWPGARLLLVGGGPDEDNLRRKAALLGDAVIFTGRVPPEHVPAHYSLVDLLVYPRLKMRLTDLVTPLKPLEAMAMTRRFIASDVGGHRELIEDGVTGRLFDAGARDSLVASALAALDPERRRESDAIVERGFRYVHRERSWDAVAMRYLPVYRNLTDAPAIAASGG